MPKLKTYKVQFLHTVEVKARNIEDAIKRAEWSYLADYTTSVYDAWNEDNWEDCLTAEEEKKVIS